MLFPLKCECIVDFLLPRLVTGWYISYDFPFKWRYQAISLRVSEVAQLEVGLSSAEVGLERRLEDRMADRKNHGGIRV